MPVGLLGVHSTKRAAFGAQDVALLDGVAHLLALANERERWQRLSAAAEERLTKAKTNRTVAQKLKDFLD